MQYSALSLLYAVVSIFLVLDVLCSMKALAFDEVLKYECFFWILLLCEWILYVYNLPHCPSGSPDVRHDKNLSIFDIYEGKSRFLEAWCTRTCPNHKEDQPHCLETTHLGYIIHGAWAHPQLFLFSLWNLQWQSPTDSPSSMRNEAPRQLSRITQQDENGTMEKRMEKSAWRFAHIC